MAEPPPVLPPAPAAVTNAVPSTTHFGLSTKSLRGQKKTAPVGQRKVPFKGMVRRKSKATAVQVPKQAAPVSAKEVRVVSFDGIQPTAGSSVISSAGKTPSNTTVSNATYLSSLHSSKKTTNSFEVDVQNTVKNLDLLQKQAAEKQLEDTKRRTRKSRIMIALGIATLTIIILIIVVIIIVYKTNYGRNRRTPTATVISVQKDISTNTILQFTLRR